MPDAETDDSLPELVVGVCGVASCKELALLALASADPEVFGVDGLLSAAVVIMVLLFVADESDKFAASFVPLEVCEEVPPRLAALVALVVVYCRCTDTTSSLLAEAVAAAIGRLLLELREFADEAV